MTDKGNQVRLGKAIFDAIVQFQQESEEDIMEITVRRTGGRPREPQDATRLGQESFLTEIRAVPRYLE
jgi:capsular polysaccharide biosynthesis protein